MIALSVLEILVGILGGLAIWLITLLLIMVRNNQRLRQLTYPAYEYALKQAEHEADEVIQAAQKQAREIIVNAEQTARADIKERQQAVTDANEKFFAELAQLHTSMHSELEKIAQAGITTLEKTSAEIRAQAAAQTKAMQDHATVLQTEWHKLTDEMKTTMNQQAATATNELSLLVSNTEKIAEDAQATQHKMLTTHIEKIVAEAQTEVAEYTTARKRLLDSHIDQLVIDVATEVLHTSLTTAQHTELAKTALKSYQQSVKEN